MSETGYDIESRLQLLLLLDEIQAAALKFRSSVVEARRYNLLLWMPQNRLNDDHEQKALDDAVQEVFDLSGKWILGVEGFTGKKVAPAAQRAMLLL